MSGGLQIDFLFILEIGWLDNQYWFFQSEIFLNLGVTIRALNLIIKHHL